MPQVAERVAEKWKIMVVAKSALTSSTLFATGLPAVVSGLGQELTVSCMHYSHECIYIKCDYLYLCLYKYRIYKKVRH